MADPKAPRPPFAPWDRRELPGSFTVEETARRVGHYLLMQLVVNTTYGIPIGVGLWLIGVPLPILALIWAFGGVN